MSHLTKVDNESAVEKDVDMCHDVVYCYEVECDKDDNGYPYTNVSLDTVKIDVFGTIVEIAGDDYPDKETVERDIADKLEEMRKENEGV